MKGEAGFKFNVLRETDQEGTGFKVCWVDTSGAMGGSDIAHVGGFENMKVAREFIQEFLVKIAMAFHHEAQAKKLAKAAS